MFMQFPLLIQCYRGKKLNLSTDVSYIVQLVKTNDRKLYKLNGNNYKNVTPRTQYTATDNMKTKRSHSR